MDAPPRNDVLPIVLHGQLRRQARPQLRVRTHARVVEQRIRRNDHQPRRVTQQIRLQVPRILRDAEDVVRRRVARQLAGEEPVAGLGGGIVLLLVFGHRGQIGHVEAAFRGGEVDDNRAGPYDACRAGLCGLRGRLQGG